MSDFKKRTFSLPLLVTSATAALWQLPVAARALRHPATSRALQEEVMLAVTSVNDCRYCSWMHTGLALEQGVNLADLERVLSGADHQLDEREAAAVLYAQHFADTVRKPTDQAKARLRQYFSPAEVSEIEAFIDLIWFANLSGNSADAVLARLRGGSVPEGHLLAELIAALLSAPILSAIAIRSRFNSGRALTGL